MSQVLARPTFERKMLSRTELQAQMAQLPRPWVFTNGVFDLLHRGHVTYLAQARSLGGSLIVAVNTDASARRLNKGPERPLNTEADRMAVLAALECVDAVTSFEEDTPLELIGALKPDYIVKGGDYVMQALPETALVQSWGGQAVAIAFEHDRSTSKLVASIKKSTSL